MAKSKNNHKQRSLIDKIVTALTVGLVVIVLGILIYSINDGAFSKPETKGIIKDKHVINAFIDLKGCKTPAKHIVTIECDGELIDIDIPAELYSDINVGDEFNLSDSLNYNRQP